MGRDGRRFREAISTYQVRECGWVVVVVVVAASGAAASG